jgi:uncharacterized repeat protein (TIGR03803 family)
MNTDGSGYAVLKHFNQNDGSYPRSSLTLADNVLYGTTSQGGVNNLGVIFSITTAGDDFTVKRSFTAADGYNPYSGLVLIGSTLYGTTFSGGAEDGGTFYKIETDGRGFTVLTNVAVTSGLHPQGELLLQDGVIYGTTSTGGRSTGGVLFAIDFKESEFLSVTLNRANNQVVLTWQATNYRLQSASAISGPYNDLPSTSSPYPVPSDDRARFFRLIKTGN